jgi:hypothetical protein
VAQSPGVPLLPLLEILKVRSRYLIFRHCRIWPISPLLLFGLRCGGASNNGGTWYINDPSGSSTDFVLNGTVAPAVMGADIDATPSSIIFPKRIKNVATTQAVTLNEVGGFDANYTSSASGHAIVTAGDAGSINAYQSGSITVGIDTTSAGAKNGNITIDDGNFDVDQIDVAGDVYDPSTPAFLVNGASALSFNVGNFAQGSGISARQSTIFCKPTVLQLSWISIRFQEPATRAYCPPI